MRPPEAWKGDVVDPGDVSQGAEGRDLPAQAEHLVDVLLTEPAAEPTVFLRGGTVEQLLLRTKIEVQPEVEGHSGPLRVQQDLEKLEKAQGTVPLGGGVLPVRRREQQGAGGLVAVGQPPLRRLRSHLVQQGTEDLQRAGAGDAAADGRYAAEEPAPVGAAEEGGR